MGYPDPSEESRGLFRIAIHSLMVRRPPGLDCLSGYQGYGTPTVLETPFCSHFCLWPCSL